MNFLLALLPYLLKIVYLAPNRTILYNIVISTKFRANLSSLYSGGCHCLLAFTQVSPYIGMIVMGVAYSLLASALWPIAALLIPEYQLGTAYGLMQAIQNLGTALITMAAGSIVDEYGYDWLEVCDKSYNYFIKGTKKIPRISVYISCSWSHS